MKQKNWNRPLRDLKNLEDLCCVPSIWQENLVLLLNSHCPSSKKNMSVVTTGVLSQEKAKLILAGQQFQSSKKKEKGELINEGDELPEPKEWFHDIYRKDGSPYDKKEIEFIIKILKE